MESLFPFLFIGGIAALVIGAIVWGIIAEGKRKTAIAAVAEQLGLDFHPDGDPNLLSTLADFQLFNVGRNRKIFNMIHGQTDDVNLGIFDYQYTTGSGKNKSTHSQTVVYIRSPQLSVPQFTLFPENLFHKLGQMFGYADINFDTHPQFSRQFVLRGNHEEAIRGVFDGELLAYLEQRPGITIEALNNHFVVFRTRTRSKPDQIAGLMEEAFKVYTMLRKDT